MYYMKLGHKSSPINQLLSANKAVPAVGKGATVLLWSDRHAYEVLEVSPDYKRVVIQRYDAQRVDKNGSSERQEYLYKDFQGPRIELTFRNGAYRFPTRVVKSWTEQGQRNMKQFFIDNPKSVYAPILGDAVHVTRWTKMDIIFRLRQEYFDTTF